MNVLERKRSNLENKVNIFKDKLANYQAVLETKNTLSDLEFIEFETQFQKIEQIYFEYDEVQNKIEEEVTIDKLPEAYEHRKKFEESYFSVVSASKLIINNQQTSKQNDSRSAPSEAGSNQNINVKLPVIHLPKFGGISDMWLEFRDTYLSLIHENGSLTEIQKFHYLRASLVGAAAESIKNMAFSAQNYSNAWTALCSRYNDTRVLMHSHIQSIVSIEPIQRESSTRLRQLIDNLSKNMRSLLTLISKEQLGESILIYLITSKLDAITVRDWEEKQNSKIPTVQELEQFLKEKASLLEKIETNKRHKSPDRRPKAIKSFYTATVSCPLCQKAHYLHKCERFVNLPIPQRIVKVNELKLCNNCFRSGHNVQACRSKWSCRKCKANHNTMLHVETSSSTNDFPAQSSEPSSIIATFSSDKQHVLLSTVVINIKNAYGQTQNARALLDCGSQSNFISESLCNSLSLPKYNTNVTVTGITSNSNHLNQQCFVEIESLQSTYTLKTSCLVMPTITSNLPNFFVNPKSFQVPIGIELADPKFFESNPIDILLGANCFWDIIQNGQISCGPKSPKLQKTAFGWIVCGMVPQQRQINNTVCNFSQQDSETTFNLKRFWELEETPHTRLLSAEEQNCEEHFVKTFSRCSDGRFMVCIPLKASPSKLGDSRISAEQQFLNLERKLIKNNNLYQQYKIFMHDYINLNHMSLYDYKTQQMTYYLPHHAVINQQSVSTKLRVVFNGSAPTTTGLSLNTIQMVGPTIQPDLFSILLRFRQHKIGICADIEKMYRQVLISPNQRNLQCILWRSSPCEPLLTYTLNTVTYGTASAPFLAIRSLVQVAKDIEMSEPFISTTIKNDFYVDDLITGTNSIIEATLLITKLKTILGKSQFKLHKWISNIPEVLKSIDNSELHPNLVDFDKGQISKTLGLMWNHVEDTFCYKITQASPVRITKRIMLSDISKIFDPLGLVSPCVIIPKQLIQQLWLHKLQWDDTVPLDVAKRWSQYRDELSQLQNIYVCRNILCNDPSEIYLHGFCDASSLAYGACIYIKSQSVDGKTCSNLLCAKSKVAPLKPTTIPRLELCAALLLIRLVKQCLSVLTIKINKIFLWSDSTIVLGWLKTPPNLLKPFVANRVSEILETQQQVTWKHVPTKLNPADHVSRGIMPAQLKELKIWWHGPEFITQDPAGWPCLLSSDLDHLPERRTTDISLITSNQKNLSFSEKLFNRFSNLSTLERVVAFCLRFKHNCLSNKDTVNLGPLQPKEIKGALFKLVQIAQTDSFSNEIKDILNNTPLKSSKLRSLKPFMGTDGLLRVGGRLGNSEFSPNKMHPILLCSKHSFTKLLFLREHIRLLHASPQQLLYSIREQFWPLAGRNVARKTVHTCIKCFRANPRTLVPSMGDLPQARVKPSPPFFNIGIDYAGPIFIKSKKGRGSKLNKAYICVLVCFATKAIHLELVGDLTTESFLLALRRFVSRRGIPKNIFSDNGKTFVGANNHLKELASFLKSNYTKLSDYSKSLNITWNFIPAYSPHFGGLWEAGVKSVKHHLKRVLGNAHFTYEDTYSALVQIEAVLNSRPLSPLSSDPTDPYPLTPAHFLIGKALTSLPERNLSEMPSSRLSLYHRIQQIQQHFWSRWSKEYISELQRRVKWIKQIPNLTPGSMVVIKDDHLPPLKWKLGLVIKGFPGPDVVIRVVEIQTTSGIVKRAVSKLCLLPLKDTTQDESAMNILDKKF